MMKLIEPIKTVILWFLIGTSIYLTFLIWTYQPEYRTLETTESFIESAEIGEEKSFNSFLLPEQVVIHEGEEQYWLMPMEHVYESLMEDVGSIEIDQLITTYTNPPSVEREYKGIELIFSQQLDREWLDRLIDMNDYNMNLEKIDRVLFYVNEKSISSEVVVRFISFEEERMYQANTRLTESDLKGFYSDYKEELVPVKAVDLSNEDRVFNRILYLPSEPFYMINYTYLSDKNISADTFKQVLFGDPELVKHYYQQGNEEVYLDGTRIMNILENSHVLRYLHPKRSNPLEANEGHVVTDSIDFINNHAGWTWEYRLDRWNHSSASDFVKFRMNVDGIPIMGANINREEYFTMSLTRMDNQITEYTRPLIRLNTEEEGYPVVSNVYMPSYDRFMDMVKENDSVDAEMITDIKIGYYMVMRPPFINFEPTWYVHERGTWKPIKRDLEGGE